MRRARFLPGFTLVELMIVLVIAGVLATLVYPSYRDHLIRGALPEAIGGLSQYAARLEEYYLDHRTYAGADDECALSLPTAGRFSFSCVPANSGQTYLLTATGVSGDLALFSFTLDENGNERTTALPPRWGTAPFDCWVLRSPATC